ncbi:MAG: molybdate ABC transporter substrate-binding protein [Thermomicrobium sp.]|nr:molybdate ABC transporter substrate-binding protein [Thermomicrobium sp.]MDW8060841.1 molybdate ABC transporter substrate-binding protein [Thermomicrobium sp.]
MFRRLIGRLSIALFVLSMLAACGGSATPTPTRAPAAVTATAGGQAGGTATATRTSSPTPTRPAATATRAATATVAATPTPRVTGEITVFAAASLTDAFEEIAQAFQQRYPGTTVTFNFAGSSQLRAQLSQGAEADVFASADWKNMQGAQQDGTIGSDPEVFARNEPVIVVPANNPAGIGSLADLAKPGIRLVLEGQDVPIGNYARQVLQKASQDPSYGSDFAQRVLANVVSEETNVKAALTKVALGEADATFVYRTDATAPDVEDKVKIVEIPSQFDVVAEYPIAVVKNAPNPAGAQAFVDFVLSPEGQRILAKWGFRTVH